MPWNPNGHNYITTIRIRLHTHQSDKGTAHLNTNSRLSLLVTGHEQLFQGLLILLFHNPKRTFNGCTERPPAAAAALECIFHAEL